ncbi:putative C1 protein [Tobacco curly shoot betasatellite]|uniref:C1 protein n=1 Tax=Tobacco curly shoot betasatellite TaxID=219596 RepID=Q8B320_9VIRU|nr:putative C1 protein [Tobacco curly shoot betasatellite]AUZ62356.1 putative C1 protein [Tobacco curly shoot betasatellite]AUZ62357.1 putative C1 protein [Tobacco curly shoot betasatellite]AWK59923.1 C1 protein [Tobacco curly shoot betasatellite]CAD13345.1 putative C1 protein [Tobacco curly shoot betasatellite]CAD30048.1 putative C1 protein [Tobacco curly shoot betasatellite]
MTIKYNNKKGMEFIVDVKLKEDNSIVVQIELISTKSPALAKRKYIIPYGHSGIIPPFNFNNLEEGIRNLLRIMYNESTIRDFKQEDMVQTIDILMMQEAAVEDIDVEEDYDIGTIANV